MTCPKCQGLLVPQPYPESTDLADSMHCVNCGLVVDALMLENRRKQRGSYVAQRE